MLTGLVRWNMLCAARYLHGMHCMAVGGALTPARACVHAIFGLSVLQLIYVALIFVGHSLLSATQPCDAPEWKPNGA
jgi:hypothetical protein